jgi:hypothetical protein
VRNLSAVTSRTSVSLEPTVLTNRCRKLASLGRRRGYEMRKLRKARKRHVDCKRPETYNKALTNIKRPILKENYLW